MDIDYTNRTLCRRHASARSCPWLQAVSLVVDENHSSLDPFLVA